MSIDPRGTTPGIIPGAEAKPKTVFMKCPEARCSSKEVIEILIHEQARGAPVPAHRAYRCTQCGHTTSISVGGYIHI